MIGSKKGKLQIIEYSHTEKNKYWKAKCECGNIRIVSTADFNKNKCPVPSCGCYRTKNISDEDRFFKFVEKTDWCWIWKGSLTDMGYGQFWNKHKDYTAHRASYRMFKGEIPNGIFVCHHCDNKKCVNPDHLFLGTAKDNTQDLIIKGLKKTTPRRLTLDQDKQVLELYLQGYKQRDIAKFFKCHQATVWRIIHESIPMKSLHGIGNCNAKLNEDKIIKMRILFYKEGFSFSEISRLFNVNPTTAERAIKGLTWSHVNENFKS